MDKELSQDLDRLRSGHLYRELRRLETAPGPRAILSPNSLSGREGWGGVDPPAPNNGGAQETSPQPSPWKGEGVLIFGSNNYLGLATHPDLCRAAADAALTWGAGSSGSRLTTGNLAIHEDLERELAVFKGCEAAIVFGSGYAAGIGAIPALMSEGDLILSDALNHASLIDGCRLSRAMVRVYRHCDPKNVQELLTDRDRFRRCLIVTDGVFSMDGDIAPLPELQRICAEHDAWLMVDDAHGTGVLGPTGGGTLEHFEMAHADGIIQMGTLSKALGSEGGFIAGSQVLIDYLRNYARSFIFSTSPAPPSIAAARAALRLVRSEPERRTQLLANADCLRELLASRALTPDPSPGGRGVSNNCGQTKECSPIVPVIVGDPQRAYAFSQALLQRGIYIPAIRPPTVPEGTARLRMSVMATHTIEDVEHAVRTMEELR